MEEKAVLMVLKVDLHCYGCYTTVKRVLCKFPLLVKGVCCTLERITKKFCCGGVGSDTSIGIEEPEKKNKEKEENEKKVQKKKDSNIKEEKLDIAIHTFTGVTPKVMAQSDQGNSKPPHSISSSPPYEGRPSYQYRSLSTVPSSYVERPIHNNYQSGEDRKGYNVDSILTSTTKKI